MTIQLAAVETTPDAVGLTATEWNGKVLPTWTPGSDSRISKQRVKRREPRQDWATIEVGGDVATYSDRDVESGKRYIYQIESRNDDDGKLGVSQPAYIRTE